MKSIRIISCPSDEDLLNAAKRQSFGRQLATHLASCESCQQTLLVDQFLTSSPPLAPSSEPLPNPHLVYQRAQWEKLRRQRCKALLPLTVFERWAPLAATAGMLWGLAELLPAMGMALAAPGPRHPSELASWLALGLLGLATAGAWNRWREDQPMEY